MDASQFEERAGRESLEKGTERNCYYYCRPCAPPLQVSGGSCQSQLQALQFACSERAKRRTPTNERRPGEPVGRPASGALVRPAWRRRAESLAGADGRKLDSSWALAGRPTRAMITQFGVALGARL